MDSFCGFAAFHLYFSCFTSANERSYQPIGHIVQLLDTQGETAANADEYEMIERALRDLESQKKEAGSLCI